METRDAGTSFCLRARVLSEAESDGGDNDDDDEGEGRRRRWL